ncbi:hypothetical protein [Polymorphospora rubra]|uniref:hypothetical protein n=1 Tax=Polymorphospora rubra TaxID=338584 RepID=UPI0033C79784
MSRRVRRLLEPVDPARGVHVGHGDVEALLDRAREDVTSYAPPAPAPAPVRQRTSLLIPVATFAVVMVAGAAIAVVQAVSGSTRPPVPYVLPGATAAACLEQIAGRLQPTSYDGQSGRYERLRVSQDSGMSTQLPDTLGMATVVYSEDWTRWLAEDGSGRQRIVRGAPEYPDEASRNFYAEHPGHLPTAGTETRELGRRGLPVAPLPAPDPAAMDRELYQPRENGPSQALVGVADLNRGRVLPAAHRVAVLRFLATTDGVVCRGELTDPTGRTGVAVSADRGRGPRPSPGDHGRELLLFDARTGELLASSGGVTPDGAMVWSTVYLERGYTDRPG